MTDNARKPKDLPEVVMPKPEPYPFLAGQKALVTGASSGIGQGTAIELARAGADVMVNHYHDEEGAEATADAIRKLGRKVLVQDADVSDEGQVLAMFERLLKEFGTIDILVANAGIQMDSPFEEMTLEKWNRVLGVNLTGQFLCARESVKEFKRRGVVEEVSNAAGKIICMSSVHEVIPWAGHANYAASKGGIMLMMKTLAQEVAPYRIRVNSIAPGAIRTHINESAWNTKEAYDKLMQLIPYNRIGEPDDIGRAVAWLASDMADYITGTSLYIDGGMTLYPGFRTGG